MTDILMHDPTNRKLWDEETRNLLPRAWLQGVLGLVFAAMVFFYASRMLPYQLQNKRDHDALLTNGTITQAQITGCERHILGQVWIRYEFTLANVQPVLGGTPMRGSCDDYLSGASLAVRYDPLNPSESEGVDAPDSAAFSLYSMIASITGMSFGIVVYTRQFVHLMLIAGKGRVRIGRIVSAKPAIFNITRIVHYEVTADDGTVLKGKRVMDHKNVVPELVAGAPIPVLYANKWAHWPFSLVPPR